MFLDLVHSSPAYAHLLDNLCHSPTFAMYPLAVAGGAAWACAVEYCSELYSMRNSIIFFLILDLETHPSCEATVLVLPRPGLSLRELPGAGAAAVSCTSPLLVPSGVTPGDLSSEMAEARSLYSMPSS